MLLGFGYQKVLRPLWLADQTAISVPVDTHPDPLVQEILELKREKAIAQAAARIRQLRPNGRYLKVFLLCNIPIPGWQPNRVVSLPELLAEIEAPYARLEAAWARYGIIPKRHAAIASIFGDLWATQYAVRKYVETTIRIFLLEFRSISSVCRNAIFEMNLMELVTGLFPDVWLASVRFAGAHGKLAKFAFDRNRYLTDEAFCEALQKLTGKTVVAMECKPGSANIAENWPAEAASASDWGEYGSGWSAGAGDHSEGSEPASRPSKQPEYCWKLWFGESKDPAPPGVPGQLPLAWLDFNAA
jgi:hypothetical protein